jgi:class 3 adenylate cyclase/tetratricopeptide (TPR) repeat protein
MARMTRHIPRRLAEKIRASQGAGVGERKLVTVLFCDLVGSTALAERMDPEEYRDLLEEYLEVVFREIYLVEGVVNQMAGDGVMALFGAPIAHEDAPYRALHAALAVRTGLRELDQRARGNHRLALQVRIGIHTGPVVVGGVGNDLKMDYTAIGDTTNLAARLQTAADPGMILVSEATYRLARGFFRFKPGRRLQVKGKTDPVTAFEVVGLSDTTTPMAIAAARGMTPLVGREGELAQLAACYARVAEGHSQIVAVGGDAGSGKSRLIYEFKQRLAGEPVVYFEARCSALTQTIPYAPWTMMLREYFGLASGECDNETACGKIQGKIAEFGPEVEAIYPQLCDLLSVSRGPAKPKDLPEDEVKRLTFGAVSELIWRAATRAPVVMIIEDLHWMDEPSREMLDLAAQKLHGSREMLLVSHRPDHQPFWRTRAPFTQINLLPLSDDETTEIMRSVAGGPLPAQLEQGIRRKAEGNPFFTEEITRALIEEGYLLRSDGKVRVTRPLADMRLPGTVEEVIGARLDRLGPQAKRTVQVAAVLGRQFHRAQLEQVFAGEGIDVAAELAALEERGIIHRKAILSDDEFRFGESLTQDVAYESLLLKQRRDLHERIARLIEATPGAPSAERSALLAHHFARGESRDRAIEALLQAGKDAEGIPAFATASRFYRKAWQLARDVLAAGGAEAALEHMALRAAHALCRMIVLYGANVPEDLGEAAGLGRALAERLGEREILIDLLTLYGMALTSNDRARYEEGQALIAEALRMAREAGSSLAVQRISRALAWSHLFDGRIAEANAVIDGVVGDIESLGPETARSDLHLSALFMRDRIRYYSDDLDDAVAGAKLTYELATQAPNHTVQSGAAATMAMVALRRADYALATHWADRSLEISEATGNTAQLRPIVSVAILARRELGESTLGRHLELLGDGQLIGGEPLSAILIADALLALGRADDAVAYVQRALAGSGGRLRQATCLAALGHALAQLGPNHWMEARRTYEQAHALAEAVGSRSLLAAIALGRGELALAQGERETALAALEDARTGYAILGFTRDAARAAERIAELRTAALASA